MTEELYDIVADKAKVFSDRMGRGYEVASPKQIAGQFNLTSEFETTPFNGHSFHVQKGQSFRFELVDGNQILDILLLNRQDPVNEYASQYHTAAVQGPAPYEGYTFVSSSPYFRPMATIIRDTVDYGRLDARMGSGGRHMFNFNNYRCTESTVELATGVVNANSCNSNLIKALYEIGGDELMMAQRHGEAFCIFQPTQWEINDGLPVMKFYESRGCFRSGDYVELLAQQDLTVVVSSCPQGGQTTLTDMTQNTNWPVAVKVYDTGIELPEIEPLESTPTADFMKQGRPGMVESKWGEPGGMDSFEWEAGRAST